MCTMRCINRIGKIEEVGAAKGDKQITKITFTFLKTVVCKIVLQCFSIQCLRLVWFHGAVSCSRWYVIGSVQVPQPSRAACTAGRMG